MSGNTMQSTQVVIAHHWTLNRATGETPEAYEFAMLERQEPTDQPTAPLFECSLPVTLTVVEGRRPPGAGGEEVCWSVTGQPTVCPLCYRPFTDRELARLQDAAIEAHLRLDPLDAAGAYVPANVILDI